MTVLYRVFVWAPDAGPGEPGHPLYVPPLQGRGRIDNPEVYHVLYLSEHPAGAVAEAFGPRQVWIDEMFRAPKNPDARAAVVAIESSATVLDLDDGSTLARRSLRPSNVATRQRSVTQRWAHAVYSDGRWDGLRWWSVWDADWGTVGLWNRSGLVASEPEPLTRRHPAVEEAAATLGRLWVD